MAEALNEGNSVADFPAPDFTIRLLCDDCGHQADLYREKVPADTLIAELTHRLRCTSCGSRECSIRIVFSGAGGFRSG